MLAKLKGYKLVPIGLKAFVTTFALCFLFFCVATSSARADLTASPDSVVDRTISGIVTIPDHNLDSMLPAAENSADAETYQIANKKKKKKKKAKKGGGNKKKAKKGGGNKKKA